MRVDHLMRIGCTDNAKQAQSKTLGKGKLNGILLTGLNTGNDELTIRLRSENKVIVISSGLPVEFFNLLSELNHGRRGLSHQSQVYIDINNQLEALGQPGISGNIYTALQPHALYIDLGHITLVDSELEFEFVSPNHGGGGTSYEVDAYTYYGQEDTDFVKVYDSTKDFDSTHMGVKSVYAFSATAPFVSHAGVYRDIDFQVETEDKTYLCNTKGLVAMTQIFNKVETLPVNYLVNVFTSLSPVPEEIRVKASQMSAATDYLVFEKHVIPPSADKATLIALQKLTADVKRLETKDAELAEKLRHANKIEKSEVLEAALKDVS